MRFPHIVTNTPFVTVFAAALFIPFIGMVHLFDWDEVNFAESSREMIVTNDFFRVMINYKPFWEKPPMFFWSQVLSMKCFGINEFGARFVNTVIGIITLVVIFRIGRKEFDNRFGLLWVLAFAGSFLPHLYFRSGIIDPMLNLFMFLGIYNFSQLTSLPRNDRRTRSMKMLWAGIFIGLGALTKGPVALVVAGGTLLLFFIVKRSIRHISLKELTIFALVAFLVSCLWFAVETIHNGAWFLQEFIDYQIRLFSTGDAGHSGPFFYHLVVLLIGCFPASVYMMKSFQKIYSDSYNQKNMKLWMVLSLIVVLVIFSIVETKIVHYSSYCYFPITFLAAYSIYKVLTRRIYFTKGFDVFLGAMGGFAGIVLMGVPLYMAYGRDIYPLNAPGTFADANMMAPVEWTGLEAITGGLYLIALFLIIYFNRAYSVQCAIALFISTLIAIQVTLITIVPKIEEHVQGSLIRFLEEKSREDAYIQVFGFKSYAHLFYGNKRMDAGPESNDIGFLLHGAIKKKTYIISKIDKDNDLEKLPGMKKIKEENGFFIFPQRTCEIKEPWKKTNS